MSVFGNYSKKPSSLDKQLSVKSNFVKLIYLIDSICGSVAMLPTYPCATRPTGALHSKLLLLPPDKWLHPCGGASEWVNQSHAELGNYYSLCRHTQIGFKPSGLITRAVKLNQHGLV